jgi:hypothetical protein
MNENEQYLFDLQGYIAVPNALDKEQLADLNALLDKHIEQECASDRPAHRFGGLLEWGKPYRDLIDNPSIVPYLDVILGERFRLDHLYADLIRSGTSPIGATLHGGGAPFDPSQYYHFHGGQMYNGLTVVAYNLADVGPEDGGFGCVPGSHKSNYRFPGEWRDMSENLEPCVRRVTGPAGTAVIFTEALTHGALPWTGQGERRTVFFKYSPHPISWSARYFDEVDYEDLTERQRAILEAPNARYANRK